MSINAGVWIDHHKAVVVFLKDGAQGMFQFLSDAGASAQAPGGGRGPHPYTPKDFVPEDRIERKTANRLNKYYDQVIDSLRDADFIAVFGPGEAKGEFVNRCERQKLRGTITHVGPADRMTDPQIAAHVRSVFGIESRLAGPAAARIT